MLKTQGFQSMLKEGYRHYAGLEEAILRNIEACKEIASLTRTSFGPNGMKKMVVNHIDKMFITNDSSTIMKEVEIAHPASKLLALASKMQEEDFGDATNYVVTLAGELLSQAEQLIKTGLHPSAIIKGYEAGLAQALLILEAEANTGPETITAQTALHFIEAALAPKLPGHYKEISKMIAEGCEAVLRDKDPKFDSDNFRVVKILGGSIEASELQKGFVIARGPETSQTKVEKAVIAAYSCPFDPQAGETKGTILLKNANELLNYNKSEEDLAEGIVKEIAGLGVNAVAVSGSISELCAHYLNKYNIFVLKIQSKFDIARFARCVGASLIPKLGAPLKEELGFARLIESREIGSTKVTIVHRETPSKLVTLVLRGATNAFLDEVERAVAKGISAFKHLLADKRYLKGAAAIESNLSAKIEKHASSLTGLEQYACGKFGQSFEVFGRILIENAGMNSNEILPVLVSKNAEKPLTGVDVFEGKLSEELTVYDNFACKVNAIKLASHAALTVLRIDQIIIAKPSGGPKLNQKKDWDADE